MAIWIKPTETDLAANLSLSEIEAFRRDGSLDGSDPVPALIERTVSFVRVSIASGGRCAKMGPSATIPPGLVIPAMDYTMGKILNRIGVPLSEDRRAALRRAEELFDKIASGHMAIEDHTESEDIPQGAMVASAPVAAPPTPQRLLDSILLACSLFTITSSLTASPNDSRPGFGGATPVPLPLQWDCNFPEAHAQTFQIYQGETVEFAPTFQINGSPATNISIEAVWIQTNGMQNAWWKLDNATFHPSNDVGASAYRFFVEAHTPSDSNQSGRGSGVQPPSPCKIYRANGTLRMLPSPGFTPAEIPWPVRRLDFNAVEIANAPWPDEISSATNAVFSAAKSYADSAIAQAGSVTPEIVSNIVVDVAPAPGNYAAVSNAAMNAIQSYLYPNTVDLENLKARWIQRTSFGNFDIVDNFSIWLQARKEDWKNEVLAQVPGAVPTATTSVAGITSLSSAVDSMAENVAATPKAVKAACDLANGKQDPATTLSGYGITDALKADFTSLTNSMAFTSAVKEVSPPADTSDCVKFLDEGDAAPQSGIHLAYSHGYAYVTNIEEVVEGGVTNTVTSVTTNSYPVVALYKDGVKVWSSDPADDFNYGWLIALILALTSGAGAVSWKYFAAKDSPAFTGTPTAPDIGAQTSSQVVTENYVDGIVGDIESILHTINNGAS